MGLFCHVTLAWTNAIVKVETFSYHNMNKKVHLFPHDIMLAQSGSRRNQEYPLDMNKL